jgi:16S rRNA (cytosine967-C5)-methyltransferase
MTLPLPIPSTSDPTARGVALRILLTSLSHEAFIQEILNHYLGEVHLSQADRRLVTQLTYGVLRRRGTLDALLRPLLDRPVSRLNPVVWEALCLGAFQLALLSHIPPHAAIYETVELVGRWAGGAKVKGFVNGVLRSLSRLLTDERTDRPAADALPLENGAYRRLARPVLPDPAAKPVEYLSAFSLPRWLARRWSERYPWDECVRLGFWFAGPAPLWLRVNPLRTDRDSFLAALRQAEFAAEPGDHPQAVRLEESASVRDLPGYAEGWFAVQDQSAMRVASALDPQPGWRVLDLCAAPGGKTTHLAELMRNEGQIIACEVDDERLRTVGELCGRLGIGIVEARRLHPEANEEPPAGPFDAVLADVPCSNTGVLGRRPEVRWRLKPGDFGHLVRLQTKLLLWAGERVRPGGVVVYSTCSVEPEENGGIVRAALQGLRELELEAEEEQVPGKPSDGGYWARLRRRA